MARWVTGLALIATGALILALAPLATWGTETPAAHHAETFLTTLGSAVTILAATSLFWRRIGWWLQAAAIALILLWLASGG